MNIVLKSRRSGRTSEAVMYCIANDSILLVHSDDEARRLKRLYPQLSVMSWHQYKTDVIRLSNKKPVVVDNADYFLRENFGWVKMAIMCIEDES